MSLPEPYYADDAVTIYHGDCRDVLASMSAGSVDAVVTSPPYNQLGGKVPNGGSGLHRGNAWIADVNTNGYADDMDEDEYASWQASIARDLARVVRPGGSMFYNHKLRYRSGTPIHPLDIVRQFEGWTLRQEIVWDRRKSMVLNARMFPPSDERIYWLVREGAAHTWNHEYGVKNLSVWQMSTPNEVNGHPCPFPEGLVARCVLSTTEPGEVVLDPFLGAGTTTHAARTLGRKAVGIEIDERYCRVAVDRLRQQTLDMGGAA